MLLKKLEKIGIISVFLLMALISPQILADDRLTTFERLQSGEYIRSPNGIYKLEMQWDGNLVLSDDIVKMQLWSTGTAGHPKLKDGNGFAEMFGQGAFGLRSELDTDINIHWSSQSWGNPGAHLRVQDDGNMVVYNVSGQAVWVSDTYQGDCRYEEMVTYGGSSYFCRFFTGCVTSVFVPESTSSFYITSAFNSCTNMFESCSVDVLLPNPPRLVRICEN
ncbi:hypothetical protein [Microbulbifer spongiae]|uniref:Bulb-type lectin domain-containing protein n=1 Tax=Microbulbifer spongiae TaxID=2944933 RepID=A0ABY9E9F3_9GAMM|nr:hypothetical protein [Microbulbifer sp. MI-G]WKD48962.1 hypothetical protein M8T91_13815 [Microbulbifer sp. MI-G]